MWPFAIFHCTAAANHVLERLLQFRAPPLLPGARMCARQAWAQLPASTPPHLLPPHPAQVSVRAMEDALAGLKRGAVPQPPAMLTFQVCGKGRWGCAAAAG